MPKCPDICLRVTSSVSKSLRKTVVFEGHKRGSLGKDDGEPKDDA